MRFLLDENLPPAFARALDALAARDGHSVGHALDLVQSGAADQVWIARLAQDGGAAISGDRRMLTRKHELRALKDSQITTFILAPGWATLRFWDKAALLVRRWPAIALSATTYPAGSTFIVPHKYASSALRPDPRY